MPETAQEYTQRLTGYVAGKNPLKIQQTTLKRLVALIKGKTRAALTKRPGPDKWSVAEVIAHLADGELVISWRLRQVLTRNAVPIQAYDQDAWARTFSYGKQDPRRSLETFRVLRENNLALLKTVPRELWDNYGLHEERGQESLSHIVRMVAGHDTNHLMQIERIVKRESV